MKPENMWVIAGIGTIIMFASLFISPGFEEDTLLVNIIVAVVGTILYVIYVVLICVIYGTLYNQLC